MELSIYEIIRRPYATTKASDLNRKLQQLVLEVHPDANKTMVKMALRKLFNVEAESVNIVCCKGRRRRVGRIEIVGSRKKKAIVTLKKGQNVNLGVDVPGAQGQQG